MMMSPHETHRAEGRFGVRGAARSIGIGLGGVLLLAGCSGGSDGDSQGPGAIADGSYQLLATSTSQAPDATVSLQITGDSVVLTEFCDTKDPDC
jgi:hypothetical protein